MKRWFQRQCRHLRVVRRHTSVFTVEKCVLCRCELQRTFQPQRVLDRQWIEVR
jgi:hypothetical protein